MPLFDDNKEGYQKYLTTAFGVHVLTGHLIAHREEFVGANGEKQFTLDLALADGASIDEDGEGRWNGIAAVYYRGRKLVENVDWHFYPGTLTTGTADPLQGEDPFFSGGVVYSGTVRLTLKLPPGVADDVDTSGIDIIARGIECGDYDADGNRTEISYTTNPARIKVFALKRAGKLAYVNWPKFVAAREDCDGVLEWAAGDNSHTFDNFVDVPTYDASGNIAIVVGTGAASKPNAVDAWDNRAVTRERILAGQDGYFKVVISGAFPDGTGGGCIYLQDANGIHLFGVCWGNGHLSVLANEVAYDDFVPPYELPAAAGDSIQLEVDDGLFVLKQNGVVKPIPQGVAPVPPDTDLFGKLMLWESSAAISSSELSGQTIDTSTPVVTEVKRFEAHPAFTAPTDLPAVLDFVDLLSASDTRMNAGKVEFLTAAPREPSFTLDDEINIDTDTLRLFEKPPGERPTQLFAFYRDTSDKFLREKPVSAVREQLFNDLGTHTRVGPLSFASMPGSQAQRLIEHVMTTRSDRKDYGECVGLPSTYRIVVGDVGWLLTSQLNRVPRKILILHATRNPGTGKRNFKFRDYNEDDYSDENHGHTQQAGAFAPGPSSTVAPPAAPVLRLSQVTDYGVGGAIVTKVRGTIYFPVHSAPLRAQVFVIKPVAGVPGTVEEDAGVGLIAAAAGTNQGKFDYSAESFGEYTFRVQVETATSSPVPGGSTSAAIEVGNLVQAIDDPQNFTADVSLAEQVTLKWDDPATNPERVAAYEVLADNEITIVMPRQLVRSFTVQGVGAGTYTWKLRALDTMGNTSAFVPVAFTVGAGAAGLTVEESDGAPTETPTSKIIVPKNWITAPAAGQVRLRPTHLLVFEFDGFGTVLTTTVDDAQIGEIPWDCEVKKWRLVEASKVPIAATATIDLWKDVYANYPPTAADSMTGTGTKPHLTGPQTANEGADFTDWASTAFIKGDVPRASIAAVTLAKKLCLVLTVEEQ